jgi:hypothetical protein
LQCRDSYYRVDRRKISFLRFIVEAYDGIGVISTIEPGPGVIVVKTAPGRESEMDDLIAALSRQIRIEPLRSACGQCNPSQANSI